jgi:adenylate cyclase
MADVGMHTETERKFLVLDDSFKAQAVASHRIKQGYIARDNGNSVRVRIKDNVGILTIKGPSANDISRSEWEIEIPLADAEALLKLCHGGIIDKTRYIIPVGAVPTGTHGHPRPCKREGPAGEASGRGREATVFVGTAPTGRFYEVDEFYGDNEGLVMAEIELGSADEEFEKPQWLGREVTGDRHYYNSFLSLHPFKTW